jgi:hypothetical protein
MGGELAALLFQFLLPGSVLISGNGPFNINFNHPFISSSYPAS